jgi:uncharacterized protein
MEAEAPARVVDVASRRATLRMVYVSDLHLGPTTAACTLENAFERIRALRPDVLLLGGDYVFMDATPQVCAELTRLVATVEGCAKFGVWGNHDLWTEHEAIGAARALGGVSMLVNERVRLEPPNDEVVLFGLDDPWTGCPDGSEVQFAPDEVGVVISHSPDGFPFVEHARPALMVCGHTHGGQIALPGGRPIVMSGKLGRRWPHGTHAVESTQIVVSRGVGGVELPVRAFAPPDVIAIDVGPLNHTGVRSAATNRT